MSKIFLCDLDDSLAAYTETIRLKLEMIRNPVEPPLPENLWEFSTYFMSQRMKLIKNFPGFWRDLPPIPEGIQIFNLAKEIGFETSILTKGPRTTTNAWTEKLEWVQKYLGNDIDVTITMNKSRQFGHVLYDDFPDYIEAWLKWRPRGLVIMPINITNKDFSHPNVVKWNGENLMEVSKALWIAYNRVEGQPLSLLGNLYPQSGEQDDV